MRKTTFRKWAWVAGWAGLLGLAAAGAELTVKPVETEPAGWVEYKLDRAATGAWWERSFSGKEAWLNLVKVPRDEVVAFALYTQDRGVLKLTTQLYPLYPAEAREVALEMDFGSGWKEVARAPVGYPGWSAHFRVEGWDGSRSVPYRVRHAGGGVWQGRIRPDPANQETIVVASMSCNSNADREDRADLVANLKALDPDLLFFAGDQSYDHQEHTAAWLLWGRQFREVLADRPVVTIPDDHDIGQGNVWAEGGLKADSTAGDSGGYYYPASYVTMVHRAQTWHLPDPADPEPVAQGIPVYFTSLRVGGVDFAILEDRKFKSGPKGKIPQMGPRPDHVRDSSYDPASIDLPGLELLGGRQLAFLAEWTKDWRGAEMKAALSQTAFCGAVHLHGQFENRLLADLDCNGWPQTGRKEALRALRRAQALHLCGDQHLAVVVQHGIDDFRDGPYGFTNPALVNTYYGRWWWPENEQPGANPVPGSPLAWTGDFRDGLGNRITMLAYANPDPVLMVKKGEPPRAPAKLDPAGPNRGDGLAVARFHKGSQEITLECWPRYVVAGTPGAWQYPGWPIRLNAADNDGRKPVGFLPEIRVKGSARPVVAVTSEASGELLYCVRMEGPSLRLPVFAPGSYTVRVGRDQPDGPEFKGLQPGTGPALEAGL